MNKDLECIGDSSILDYNMDNMKNCWKKMNLKGVGKKVKRVDTSYNMNNQSWCDNYVSDNRSTSVMKEFKIPILP